MLDRLFREAPDCTCTLAHEGARLLVDATDCDGRLGHAPACRATVVAGLAGRDVDRVVVRAAGAERRYEDSAAALLVAAGRFAERAGFHDDALAERARTDPVRAGRDAAGRAGPVARIAAETGLADIAARTADTEAALSPYVGPTLAQSRVATRPPPDGRLRERFETGTDAVVRVYDRSAAELPTFHLTPVEGRLSDGALATLADAHRRLAEGTADGPTAPGAAVRAVAGDGTPVETLRAVLRKHTRGHGVLDDLFAADCDDAFVTAPVGERPVRVRYDGETMRTNVRFTPRAAATLASRLRRASGRAFSRADPTLDATLSVAGRRIRAAGVTDPVSDGVGFAFRGHDRTAWTLPALVATETLPPDAAALCSLAIERGAAVLFAGPRGAGKTTALGACCFELPAATRTVAIEDTPELPVESLRTAGRDVQRLHVSRTDDGPLAPDEALRTALRLGDGALVVGEIRGTEAGVLFEAMRVGGADGAVMGTVHGEGAAAVRARLVDDLGVAPGALGATDLVVTLSPTPAGRRVTRIEEVSGGGPVGFASLFEGSDPCSATGRIDRGNSRVVATLTRPDETYADVRAALAARADWLARQADRGTDPEAVTTAHAARRADA